METTNMYLYKAIDAYPYDLVEAVESLNYALSYEPENAHALFLMARLHSEQLHDTKTAIEYFEAAFASELYLVKAYPHYLDALIKIEAFTEAQKFIDFAFTVKGVDKPLMTFFSGVILESQEQYKEAIKTYKKARKMALNSDFVSFANTQIERVKGKMTKKKSKNKKKSKRKKKGSKK